MAFITLAGTLRDPTSELAVGDQIRFTHKSTTGETIEGAVSVLTIDPSGTYSKDLQYGLVLVEYKDVRTSQFKNLGVATVNGSNPATSIPELLNALVPVSSAELIEFQAILADAVTARNEAEAFANSIDLINDLSQAYIFDTVVAFKTSLVEFPNGKEVKTKGYYTKGDGGGASYSVASAAVTDGYADHTLSDGKSAKLDTSEGYFVEQFGVLTTRTATENGVAMLALVSFTGGSFSTRQSGIYQIDKTITISGNFRRIQMFNGGQFHWLGLITESAFIFSNGNNNSIRDLTVSDETAGADNLVVIDTFNRSEFYNLYLTANAIKLQGAALLIKDSILLSFFKMKIFGNYIGMQFSGFVVTNNWYDLMIETCTFAGIWVEFNSAGLTKNNVFGGTIENCAGSGYKQDFPTEGFLFKGVYFELNGIDFEFTSAGSMVVPIVLEDCRFKSTISGSAIYVAPAANARIITRQCNHVTCSLIDSDSTLTKYVGENNISKDGVIEVAAGSVGILRTRIDQIDGSVQWGGQKSLQLSGFNVPIMQEGAVASLAGGASLAVAFPIQFLKVPKVLTNVDSPDVTTVVVTGTNLAQTTFRNKGTSAISFEWVAISSLALY